MLKIFNSLQFRLYAAFVLLAGLLALTVYSTQVRTQADEHDHATLSLINSQGTTTYLLASLVRRLEAVSTPAEKDSLTASIDAAIAKFEQIRTALRTGNEELEIESIERPEVIPLLDTLDAEWDDYRPLLESYVTGDIETRDALEPRIDNQSAVVYTYTDRISKAFNALLEQENQATQALLTGIAIIAALIIVYAIVTIVQIVRSINKLAYTANAFADGKFETRADTKTFVEVAQVGRVFNNMASQLGDLIVRLEQQVAAAEAARERAEKSDKVKSAFLASMSHELRTPLNAIINFSKFLIKGVAGPMNDEQKVMATKVTDSAKHLLHLINDVLDMSKIESGSLTLFVEDQVNPRTILDTAISTARGLLDDKPIELQTDIDPDIPLLKGDRQRILQILLNMVSNACKFTQTGIVKISAWHENGELVFSVQDTGPGISPEDQALVFLPFQQTDNGLRQGGGTGLGMPISKNLVEAHGGRIWLDSTPGQGSTFYAALPIRVSEPTPVLVAVK